MIDKEKNTPEQQSLHEQLFRDSDLGHAEQLIEEHGRDFLYCPELGGWWAWTGVRWEQDTSGEVYRRTYTLLKYNLLCAAETHNTQAAKKIVEAMKANRIESILRNASKQEQVRVKAESFDADPYLFNCINGTIDLRSGQLRGHNRNDLITKLASVEYVENAPADEWGKFLERILPDDELRAFVQRAVGYSMTGDTSEQCMFINHGSTGSNGKSTFMEAMHAALGDYAMHTPVDTLMIRRGGIPNDVARLKGQRFVTASESEEGQRLAESKVKEMTGQDTIAARFMRGEWFDFKPTHKLWLSTNHKPKIRGTEDAIWRRIRLIPFDVTIPKAEQDRKLPERLRDELPGILAWAVRGSIQWRQDDGLKAPTKVRKATASYRSQMDVLAGFIVDECVEHPDAKVGLGRLYEVYKTWASDAGEFVKDKREFESNIEERGKYDKRRSGSNGSRQWHGIGLKRTEN